MIVYKNTANERVPIATSARQVTVQVVRREVLMDGVVRLSLALPGTIQAPAPYLPGQFITLALSTQRQMLRRSYSLCGNGQPGQPWVITIKRQPMGVVSTYLYEQVREGMTLQASLPQGTFVLPARLRPDVPLIFVAAGSGITPIFGMLGALALLPAERRPRVQLHYAARTPAEMIYLKELNALDPHSSWLERRYYFSAQGRRLTPQAVLGTAGQVARQAQWYICGPEALKQDMHMALREAAILPQQVHVETFASPRPAARSNVSQFPGAGSAAGTRLRVADTGAVLHVQPQETLLEALERHGYDPDYSCRAGACGACKLRLLGGQVHPAGDALSDAERRAGYVLGCVTRPAGDVVIASGGQPPVSNRAGGARRAPARRQEAIRRVRTMTAVAVLGLLVGSWSIIHYKPESSQASTSSSSSQSSGDDQQNTSASSSSSSSSSSSGTSTTTSQPPATTTQSGTS
jgi:ferredoxin-NADP reductase